MTRQAAGETRKLSLSTVAGCACIGHLVPTYRTGNLRHPNCTAWKRAARLASTRYHLIAEDAQRRIGECGWVKLTTLAKPATFRAGPALNSGRNRPHNPLRGHLLAIPLELRVTPCLSELAQCRSLFPRFSRRQISTQHERDIGVKSGRNVTADCVTGIVPCGASRLRTFLSCFTRNIALGKAVAGLAGGY